MNKGIIWVLSFLLVLFITPNTIAQSPSEHGLDIARAFSMANQGFHSIEADLTIMNEDINGNRTHKQVALRSSELAQEGKYSMIFLEKSGEDRGNTTWIVTKENSSNKQWTHHVEDFRPKTIKKAHTAFMGTEFIFEDFAFMEVEKFSHKLLRDEMDDEDHIYVVERKPLDIPSVYHRQVVWYNASKAYRIEKIVFYDQHEQMLKTLRLEDYKKFMGKYWRAKSIQMQNHQTGGKTIISFDNYKFQGEVQDGNRLQTSIARMRQGY